MNSVSIAPSTTTWATWMFSRPQFARHALGQGPQRMLGAGERGEVRRAAQPGGGTGEEDRAATASDHPSRHFAAVQEAAEAGHLPDLEVLARRFVEDARRHVGADVEHQHFDGADVALDAVDERDHFVFVACIGAEAVSRAPGRPDRRQQRLELRRRRAG